MLKKYHSDDVALSISDWLLFSVEQPIRTKYGTVHDRHTLDDSCFVFFRSFVRLFVVCLFICCFFLEF